MKPLAQSSLDLVELSCATDDQIRRYRTTDGEQLPNTSIHPSDNTYT